MLLGILLGLLVVLASVSFLISEELPFGNESASNGSASYDVVDVECDADCDAVVDDDAFDDAFVGDDNAADVVDDDSVKPFGGDSIKPFGGDGYSSDFGWCDKSSDRQDAKGSKENSTD